MPKSSSIKPQVSNIRSPRVAIVADWIYGGGSERVVEQLHELYPEAPIYTSYCSDEWRQKLHSQVVTGYLQRAPFRQLRKFLPLLRQWWFARLDLSGFDIIISCTGNGEAKFVRPQSSKSDMKRPLHISYCYTPVHYYWRHYEEYLRNPGFKPAWLARLGLKLMVKPLRKRDYTAAQQVDEVIAISSHIQADIKKYYNRDSIVIYPPVNISHFTQAVNSISVNNKLKSRNGFVTMGRQVPLKRTELIIEACNELALPLRVIGRGPEHNHLVSLAGPTVTLQTNVSDEQMPYELASAEAFLFASFEDFGIAPIEAMAVGTPVIAYQAGGALDYVIPGQTGEFFTEQSKESLINALRSFNARNYNPSSIQQAVQQFAATDFRQKIKSHLDNLSSL